jgi:predicted nucleic acid-binding protein
MIVLDSSFLVAYFNTRDVHHAAAARAMVQLVGGQWGQALLLEYVLLEVATVLRARCGHAAAAAAASGLLQAREVDFVPCSDFFLETLGTFRGQASGRLSFADAAIVTIARSHPPGHVATFDADFTDMDGVTVAPAQAPSG